MKKIIVFALIALACLSACSSDDEEPQNMSVVGKWTAIAFYSDDFWTYAVKPHYWIFKNDGTYESNFANYSTGTYTFNGTTLTLNGGFGESVKFSEDGKKMEWGKWRYEKQ